MKAGLKRWFGMFSDMDDVVKRFPVPVAAMAVFTLIIIFKDAFPQVEKMIRLLSGLVLGGYLCVSYVLASESHQKRPQLTLQICIVVISTALAWLSKALQLNLPMAIGAAVLLLGNAVIWRKNRNDLHVWDFTHKLWTGAIFAAAGSVIFTWGIFAIMMALQSLFEINIRKLAEHFLLPVGLGFLAPLYWMATLPPVDEDFDELYENPTFVSKAVAFMGTWLLSPLTLIYALILLAYGLKIVATGELPKGEIAKLTTPFLIVGTLTWLVLDPPFTKSKALAQLFRKLWWPVSIPAALLLAVAVIVRISEYGITPQRFALIGLVLWTLGLAGWFTFAPKARRDIRFIPGFASVLLTLGALGAGWLSLANQDSRFKSNLKVSGIVSSDGSVSDYSDIEASRRAKGALRYLMNNGGESRVEKTLSRVSVSVDSDKMSLASVEKALGLEKVSTINRWSRQDEISFSREEKAIPIAGYDTLRGPFSVYSNNRINKLTDSTDALTLYVDDGILSAIMGEETFTFDIGQWIDAQNFTVGEVEIQDPSITIVNRDDLQVTLIITRFNSWTNHRDGEDASHINMSFYLLSRGAN